MLALLHTDTGYASGVASFVSQLLTQESINRTLRDDPKAVVQVLVLC